MVPFSLVKVCHPTGVCGGKFQNETAKGNKLEGGLHGHGSLRKLMVAMVAFSLVARLFSYLVVSKF